MAVKITCARKYATDTHGYLGIQQFANGKTKKGLGIKVEWEHWKKYFNHEFKQFSTTAPFPVEEINKTIMGELLKFENGVGNFVEKTNAKPQQAIIPSANNNGDASVLNYLLERLEVKKTEGTKGNYMDAYKKLKKFLAHNGKTDFTFDEFTPEFIERFKKYCLSVPDPQIMSEGGFRAYMRVVKAIYNMANDNGFYYFKRNPFVLAKSEKYQKREKHPLEVHQIHALMDMGELSYMYKITRNMFYFQLLANGMRCSDVMFLKYKDFKNGRLFYKMMKTNRDSGIPIGFKMVKVFSEILGEESKYEELLLNTTVFDIKTDNRSMTLAQLDEEIISICPQVGFVKGGEFDSYKGFTIYIGDERAKGLIDVRHEHQEFINEKFVEYMQGVIDEQRGNDFVFLSVFAPKQVKFFKDYNKGDILTEEQFLKYKAIRNKYNVYLRELSEKYNSKIPNVKDKWKLLIKLSSHVARNTFVDVLLKANVDVYTISHGLVHSDLKTTQNYIKKEFDSDRANSANKTLNSII